MLHGGGVMMKKSALFASLIVLVVLLVGVVLAAPPQAASGTPQYTKDGELLRPADYRDWVFLSSGFGMSYSPGGHAMFTNVFVPRPAYEQFLNTGKWPEKTMFVVPEKATEAAPPAQHWPETSTWAGILHTPDQHEQRVILHIFGSGDNLSATADSPDENAYAMPVASIALTSNSLRFSLPQFGGEFNGTLAGSQATGTYSQNGTPMPLVLSKK